MDWGGSVPAPRPIDGTRSAAAHPRDQKRRGDRGARVADRYRRPLTERGGPAHELVGERALTVCIGRERQNRAPDQASKTGLREHATQGLLCDGKYGAETAATRP